MHAVSQVCRAQFRGVNRQRVIDAIQRKNKRHDLRVAYEIILDHKQSKARTQEVQMIMQVRACLHILYATPRALAC